MALVSENRKEEGLALNLSVADNLTLSKLPWVMRPSRGDRSSSAGSTAWACAARAGSGDRRAVGRQPAEGGHRAPPAPRVDILLLDEPTRGIDVASKAQIYQLIDELVSRQHPPRA